MFLQAPKVKRDVALLPDGDKDDKSKERTTKDSSEREIKRKCEKCRKGLVEIIITTKFENRERYMESTTANVTGKTEGGVLQARKINYKE